MPTSQNANKKVQEHRPNPRGTDGFKTDQVKGAWKKSGRLVSLRTFARQMKTPESVNWLFNKQAKTAKPRLGLGCTRKRKGSTGGKK